jgi:hypothetical protein
MVFTKNDNFGLVWLSAEILKNTQNINGVRLKISTFPDLTPLRDTALLLKKISYN